MTVLNYTIETDVSNHHVFVEKLKDFCSAQGWTIDDFQQNVQWAWDGAKYDWLAGGESFLEVTSSGHGAQTLNFRFRAEAAGADPEHEWLQMSAQLGEAINDALSTHPVDQDRWNAHKYTSLRNGNMPVVWFFGNDTFVLAAIKFNSTYCEFISFGSVELIDTADTEGNFAGYSNINTGSSAYWYNKNYFVPFDILGDGVYYDSGLVAANRFACNMTFTTGNLITGDYAKYGNMLTKNAYSEARPLMKPKVWIKHTSDDLWRRLGNYPIYRLDHRNLKLGETLTYGSEEYVTFPMCRGNDERYYGLAARIA